MEYDNLIESVMDIAKNRHHTLHELPTTLASVEPIAKGLVHLPDSLPLEGLGDTKALDLVKQHLLPALIPGQNGSRLVCLQATIRIPNLDQILRVRHWWIPPIG
jgi:hypothetical protein